jgi:hypothetical protein
MAMELLDEREDSGRNQTLDSVPVIPTQAGIYFCRGYQPSPV